MCRVSDRIRVQWIQEVMKLVHIQVMKSVSVVCDTRVRDDLSRVNEKSKVIKWSE